MAIAGGLQPRWRRQLRERIQQDHLHYRKSRNTKSEDQKKKDRIIANISDFEKVCPICHNAYSQFLSIEFIKEVGSIGIVPFGELADRVKSSLRSKGAYNPNLCIECAILYSQRIKKKRYAKIRNMVRKLKRSIGKEKDDA